MQDTLQPSSTPFFMGVLPGEIWRDAGMQGGVAFLLLVSFDLVPSVPKVQFKNRMRKIGEDSASRNSVAAAIHCLGTCPYGPPGWTEESERFWCSSSLHPRWHYTDMFLKIDVHTGYIMVPVLFVYILQILQYMLFCVCVWVVCAQFPLWWTIVSKTFGAAWRDNDT